MLQVEKQRTKVADTKPLDYIFTNAGRTISDEEILSRIVFHIQLRKSAEKALKNIF